MFRLLSPDLVEIIHEDVLNPGDLKGRSRDASLDGALSRVDNRLAYGLVEDVFVLAALYAQVVAQGRCFSDGNKRTAFRSMYAVLALNGVTIAFDSLDVADRIILLAQGKQDPEDLGDWLRDLAAKQNN